MNKIYQFFAEVPQTLVTQDNLFGEIESKTIAMLELFNMEVRYVKHLTEKELFTLHNALIRVKYFQETGKVLNDKNFK
jgi:hypothetical protein